MTPKTIMITALSALALVFVGGMVFMSSNTTAQPVAATTQQTTVDVTKEQLAVDTAAVDNTPVTTTPAPATATTKQFAYKDGTYTATGAYQTPESTEHITVTLTLKNDVVIDASVSAQAQENQSARYQSMFAANFKQYVVGKDISTLSLSHVSGSSLTSGGFNQAVAQIKAQAKA